MVNKLGIIVQAHMGSTRLKNKMMLDLCGESVISRVISRIKKADHADLLIIATSNLTADDCIVEECKLHNVNYFRGDDQNVLKRFYDTAKKFNLSDVARVCADNTLVDWEIINSEIDVYRSSDYDIVTTGKTVPLGLGCEIFSFELLQNAYEHASKDYHFEHVTPYLYEQDYKIFEYNIAKDFGKYRFTLDAVEDFTLIKNIYNELRTKEDFVLRDVIKTMEANRDWIKINENVKQITF